MLVHLSMRGPSDDRHSFAALPDAGLELLVKIVIMRKVPPRCPTVRLVSQTDCIQIISDYLPEIADFRHESALQTKSALHISM